MADNDDPRFKAYMLAQTRLREAEDALADARKRNDPAVATYEAARDAADEACTEALEQIARDT